MRRVYFILLVFSITAKANASWSCASTLKHVIAQGASIALSFLVPLRYVQEIEGMREAFGPYPRGTVTCFNHPAGVIDPGLLKRALSKVMGNRRLRFLMLETEAKGVVGEIAAVAANAILVPDAKTDPKAKEKLARTMKETIEALDRGENIAISISGAQYRTHLSKSMGTFLYELRQKRPHTPIIAARTKGLFGSSGSYGFNGTRPSTFKFLAQGAFFTAINLGMNPKRNVTHSFRRMTEVDIPLGMDVVAFNHVFDSFFNDGALPNIYVPRSIWALDAKPQEMPDPVYPRLEVDLSKVPIETKEKVYLLVRSQIPKELQDKFEINDDTEFTDIGISSLPLLDLIALTEDQFPGMPIPTYILSVKELIAASQGHLVGPKPGVAR